MRYARTRTPYNGEYVQPTHGVTSYSLNAPPTEIYIYGWDSEQTMAESFKVHLLESMSALIVSAFGLVAALAWNEAIKQMVGAVFKSSEDLIGLTIYALLVTIIAVAATMLITRATEKAKRAMKGEKKEEE